MGRLLVFTQPDFFSDESKQIIDLFTNGLQHLHLRKPHATYQEVEDLLKTIPSEFHSRITIHDHFRLTEQYAIGGVHLNSRNKTYDGSRIIRLSKSCHTFDELNHIDEFEYVTLSPIFDSISKQGYGSAFSKEELIKQHECGRITSKVIALGGIDCKNCTNLPTIGFGGVAMLGAIWKNFNIEMFRQTLCYVNKNF